MANQFIKTALPVADLNQLSANNDAYNGISAAKHQFVQDMSYDNTGSFNAASSALGTILATETPEQESMVQRKANALADATQRKRAALGDEQDRIDLAEFESRLNGGENASDIQASMDKKRSIRNKSPEERLANYLSPEPAFDDPEFANDVATKDDYSLRALYGENVLQGIRSKKLQDIQDYNTAYASEQGSSSWFNGRNIAGAITSGIGESVDALGSALNFATKSGEERMYAELNPYTAGKRIQEFGKDMLQKDYQDNEDVQAARSNLVDAFEKEQFIKYRATMTDENAKAQARSDAEWLSVANALEDSKGIVTELWQNIPDLVASGGLASLSRMAVGGASKAMLEAEAKRQLRDLGKEGIKKEAKEMASKEALEKAEKAATKAGTKLDDTSAEAIKKAASESVTSKKAFDTVKAKKFDEALEKSRHRANVVGTVGESIKTGFEESAGTYEQAAQTVLSMDSAQVANTKEGKKLKEEHPEWSDDKIKQELAMRAGEKSYEYNVETQAALGGIFAGPELRMFDKVGRATGVKGKVGKYAKSIASQAVEEGVGEGANTYATNKAINKALGEDVVDTTKGMYADAVRGALSGGLSTGITNVGELMPAAKKAVAKPLSAVAKVKQDQAKEKANLEFQSILSGATMPTQDTSIKGKVKSAVGKNSYDKDQVDELNTAFANTNFGALAQANKEALKQRFGVKDDEDVGFFELADQYDKQISKMTKDYIELDKKGEDNLTPEEKATYDQLQEQIVSHYHYTAGLRQALEQDAVQAMSNMSEAEREAYIQSVESNPIIAKIKGKTALENYLEAKEVEQQSQQSEDYSVQVNDQTTASVINDTGSASIKKTVADFKDQVAKIDADTKLTPKERTALKSKLAKGMVASVKNIATRDALDTDNITTAWSSIGTMTKDIIDTLNDTDSGIEANTKNSLVKLLQYIHGTANAIEMGEIPSKTEQLTQYEKLIGSAGRGRQMRGLLDYAQEALNNKGKLGVIGALQLQHFRLTQQEKMKAAEKLLNDADEQNLFDGKGELKEGVEPLVLVNRALKNQDKRQRKQSGDDFTKFTNRKALQVYIRALKNDASLDGIFDTLSGKVSGTKATKDTSESKPKKESKPSKETTSTNTSTSTTPSTSTQTTPKVDTKKLQQYLEENSEDFGYDSSDLDFANTLDSIDDFEIEIPDVEDVLKPIKSRNYDVSDLDDLFGSASIAGDQDLGSASVEMGYSSDAEIAAAQMKVRESDMKDFVATFLSRIQIPKGFQFTTEQWHALKGMVDFIKDRDFSKTITVSGYAGTGKTTIVKYAVDFALGDPKLAAYIAPTWKAASVIAHNTGTEPAVTQGITYINKEGQMVFTKKFSNTLRSDVIIVDESSFLSPNEINNLKEAAKNGRKQLIFMGDPAQLPPIASADKDGTVKASYVFNETNTNKVFNLSEVKRINSAGLLAVLTAIRNHKEDQLGKIPVVNTDSITYTDNPTKFLDEALPIVVADPNNNVLIANTNKSVTALNKLTRDVKFGNIDTSKLPVQVGEKLIGYIGSGVKGKELGFTNSMVHDVLEVSTLGSAFRGAIYTITVPEILQENGEATKDVEYVPLFPTDSLFVEGISDKPEILKANREALGELVRKEVVKALNATYPRDAGRIEESIKELVKTLPDFGSDIFFSFHPDKEKGVRVDVTNTFAKSTLDLHKQANAILRANLNIKKGVDFPYAITTHKSQGSTYQNVFFNARPMGADSNVVLNGEVITSTANALNYVAMSRASKHLTVFTGGAPTYQLDATQNTTQNASYPEFTGKGADEFNTLISSASKYLALHTPSFEGGSVGERAAVMANFPAYNIEDIKDTDTVLLDYQTNADIVNHNREALNKVVKSGARIILRTPKGRNAGAEALDNFFNIKGYVLQKDISNELVRQYVPLVKSKNTASYKDKLAVSSNFINSLGLEGNEAEDLKDSLEYIINAPKNPLEGHQEFSPTSGMGSGLHILNYALNAKGLEPTYANVKSQLDSFAQTGFTSNGQKYDFPQMFKGVETNAPLTALLASEFLQAFGNPTNDKVENINNAFGMTKGKNGSHFYALNTSETFRNAKNSLFAKVQGIEDSSVKGKRFTSASIQELAKDWNSTAEIIAPQYNDEIKAEYRLKGLDLTDKGATNILNNPDVKYSERTPLFNQDTLDKINSKDSGVTEEQVLAGKYADGEVSGGDRYFLKGLAHLNADIKRHLETSILSPLQNPKKDAFNLNGFLNFTTIREVDGKRQVEMSDELLTGMVNALAETVSTPTISSKGSFVRESYTDNGANEITLVDITSNPNISSEAAIKDYKKGIVPEILTTDYALSNLGTIKSEFISELGRKTLRNLGIKVDPNSDVAGQMEGLAFSLGTELFNYLHANGLVNVQRIYKHPPETSVEASTVFIDHVSFAWDSERAVDTKKDHFKRGKARNLFRKGISFNEYKKAVAEFVASKGDNTVLAMALLNRFNDTRVANDLFPNRDKGYRGFRADKPYTVTNEDVKNVTTSGANSLQTSMIQAQNNIKFSFNVNNKGEGFANFALTDTNESFIKEWLGYTTDLSGNTTAITKSLTSKNNQLDRSFDIAKYANDTLSVDDEGNEVALADRHAYLKHRAISTQRTTIDGDFNPQADKFHREIFVPTFTNPDGSRMEWGFDAKGMNRYNIAKTALHLYNNRTSFKDSNHYDQVTGFALALAQALGVKVERNKVADALTKLDSILSSSAFDDAMRSISDRIEGKESALPKAAIKTLGLDSPRALNAVYQLALMEAGKGLNSKGQFQPMLMIEADGIGNGVHNNLRQFSTNFTENYLHTLKRTGVVTLDFIANAEDAKELEGSREIFTSDNPNDTIDDVYNVVANSLTNRFQRLPTLADQYNIADNTLNELINSGFINAISHELGAIGTLTKAKEHTKAQDNEIIGLLKTLMVLNQTENFENGDIGDIPLGQLGKLIVKRGVAKLAVTPSNYGGKRTGINNQVNGEFKSSYLNQLNDLYRAINKDGLTPENKKALARLIHYGQTIHMASSEISYGTKEEALGVIEDMSNMSPEQSAQLTMFNYSGISTLLYEGIRDVYGEQFKEVDAIIANDQMLYYAFEQEFLDKLNNFVKQRNIKKGWAEYTEDGVMHASDSRAYDFPKAHELREILGNLVNSPNVATAMSKDSQLINDLYHVGNSITKEQLLRNNHSMTTVTSVYLNPESNTHIGAVLNKSWKHFESSGPSLLTSSIVGTEAATQGYLAIEMEKNGTPTLDVYDGVEVWGFMRNFVGNKVNEITNQVHLDNSLMKSFYEKLARSNVGEMFLEHTAPEFRSIEKRFSSNALTQEDAKKLKGILGAYTSAWYIDNDDVNQEYEAVRTFLDKVIDSDGSTDVIPSKTAREALERMIKREYNSIESGFLPTSYSLFEASLKKARERAIDNLAMKDIEREYLPVIINQFGGISNGYYHGEDMPKVVDTINRFNEWMANHPDKSTTFRKDSKAITEFIAQDKVIQEALQKARAKHARALPLKLPTNKMEAKPEYTKSATDLIKSIKKNLTGDNLDTKVLGSLVNAFEAGVRHNEKVYDRKLEVFTDFNEFLNKLPEDVRAKIKDMNLNGYYHPLAGIYINPVQFELGNMKDLIHELSHAALNSLINAHYLSKRIANSETTAAINLIEAIAKDMAKLFAYDSKVMGMVKQMRKFGDFDVNSAYRSLDKVRATMANINYVFDPQTAREVDAITLAKAKAEAIKEFIAYGLTESEFLNRLESSGLRNRNKVLEETGFKAVMVQFKDLLDKFMNAFHRLLGFNHKNLNKSYLADMVRAVNVLTMDTTNYAKQNEIDEGNASVASTVANYEAVSQSAPISDKHRAFLNELVEKIKTRAPVVDMANFTEEREALENNDTDKQTNDFLVGLRNAGISVSSAEESAFRLAYASAKANFMGGNSNYVNTATTVVNDVMDSYDFSNQGINNAVFNSPVFAKNKEFNVPAILSAITTVEELKNKFDTKRSQKAMDKVNDFILTRALELPKDASTLESLALIAGSVNFRDKLGHLDKLGLEMEEAKKEASKSKLIKDIDDIAKALPYDALGKTLVGAAGVILSGDNISDDGDSTIGKALQDYAEATSYLAGRPTLISKILRYFRGSYSDVHYIYDMQNKASVVAEATREKIGNAVNANIEKQFSNGISPEMDKTITSYMSTMAYKLKGTGIDPFDPINNYGQIKSMIKTADSELHQVVSSLPVQDKEGLTNFLRWQSEGLADLIQTGSAKATSKTAMTGILPNSRAIVSMTLYNQMSGERVNLTDDQKATLLKAVDKLVALHSIDKLGNDKVQEIKELIRTEPKGMKYINQELTTLDSISNATDSVSVFGYDGYSHAKRNPHQDYVIVSKDDDETAKRLTLQGYKVSATLPNGERVFTTNNSLATTYTNGALALTESSKNGANIVTGERMGDRTLNLGASSNSVQHALRSEWASIRRNPSYYSGLQEESMYQPIMDRLGKVTGVKAALNNKLKDQFKETVEKGYESIGNYYARIGEERIVSNNNIEYVKQLNQAYTKDPNKAGYVKLDGNYKAKGNSNEDIRFEKAINEFYYQLPAGTRNYIDSIGGLYVKRNELDNIIGYNQASITDIFTGKSGLPDFIQKPFKTVANVVIQDFFGMNPAQFLKYLERGFGEVAALSKDYVLVRSGIVPLQNILSNVIHLWNTGVPVNRIAPLMLEGYKEAKRYTELHKELLAARHTNLVGGLPTAEIERNKAKARALEVALEKLSVAPLIRAGLLTSISDLSNDTVKEDDEFSLLTKAMEKSGIKEMRKHTPELVKSLMVYKGSKGHNIMSQFMDYGDFVAKYALYQHLTQGKGIDSEKAMNVVRDEFVNYSMNRGREFDWANKVGLTWFLSYKLAIQKIIYRNLRKNTLRTLATWAGGNVARDVGLGIIQTVPQQRLWFDYSGYHFEADNIYDNFKSHWLMNLL